MLCPSAGFVGVKLEVPMCFNKLFVLHDITMYYKGIFMENDLVTISARIPRKLNDDLEGYAKRLGYASKTEVLREMLRNELYGSIGAMRGALKGKVALKESMAEWRRNQWNGQLLRAGGDRKKAAEISKKDEEKALSGLRLKVRKE